MSVLLETSLGDIVIDLEVEACPKTCENFLKLCKTYYYNFNAFFSVQKDFLAQTGDPSASGQGGESIWARLPSAGPSARYFAPEMPPKLKHKTRGTVSMAVAGDEDSVEGRGAGSQFFVTLADDIEYLDGKHAVFGHVVEGQEPGGTLDKINETFTDQEQRPLKDIRIRHVIVLDDPFPDPPGLQVPSRSPSPRPEQRTLVRLADDETIEETRPLEEVEASRREHDASAAALTLEMVGDLPFAEVRPPENILFVCKLNPVTRSEDLELIFSRFGKIMSCEVIKDKKTGDSLQYAFIEFDKQEAAEMAYFKMQNVLVDDRRIWVDFSQSVSKLHGDWIQKRTGRKPPVSNGPSSGSKGGKFPGPSRSRNDRSPSPPGYGGRENLQAASRYRGGGSDGPRAAKGNSGMGMVFDHDLRPRGSGRDRPPPPRDDPPRSYADRDDRGHPRARDEERRESSRRQDGRDGLYRAGGGRGGDRDYGHGHGRPREYDERDRDRDRDRRRGGGGRYDERDRERDRERGYRPRECSRSPSRR